MTPPPMSALPSPSAALMRVLLLGLSAVAACLAAPAAAEPGAEPVIAPAAFRLIDPSDAPAARFGGGLLARPAASLGNLYASPAERRQDRRHERRPAPRPARLARFDATSICDAAIRQAAARHGVPLRLMRAVGLVESGKTVAGRDGERRRISWPWTVNMEGAGRWFDSQAEALAYVRAEQRRGARSFDVGCMQLNHRWHGQGFASLEDMFDPAQNADYAARFLKDLMAETGDWMRAAGYYHSRTPKYEQAYRAKVKDAAALLAEAAPRSLDAAMTARLLKPGQRPRAARTERADRWLAAPPAGLSLLASASRHDPRQTARQTARQAARAGGVALMFGRRAAAPLAPE